MNSRVYNALALIPFTRIAIIKSIEGAVAPDLVVDVASVVSAPSVYIGLLYSHASTEADPVS